LQSGIKQNNNLTLENYWHCQSLNMTFVANYSGQIGGFPQQQQQQQVKQQYSPAPQQQQFNFQPQINQINSIQQHYPQQVQQQQQQQQQQPQQQPPPPPPQQQQQVMPPVHVQPVPPVKETVR